MLEAGQIVEVEVQSVAVFGLFCRHGTDSLLVLIPELSWIASFNSSHQFAAPGDRLRVIILHVDTERGKIAAGVKQLHPDPWLSGSLAAGTTHLARVVRFVEQADRCDNGPAYLIELLPGAYAMLAAGGLALDKGELCSVTITGSNPAMRAVRVALNGNRPTTPGSSPPATPP